MRIWQRGGISRTVRQKNSVGIERQHFFRSRRCRDNSNCEAFLAQQAQDVFLDAIIVRRDAKSNRGKGVFASTFVGRKRPVRAQLIVGIPLINFRCGHLTHVIHSDYAFAFDRHLRRFFRRNLFRCQTGLHRAARAQMSRQRTGVNSLSTWDFPFSQIFIERHFRAPTAWDIG